ncbi:MAG: SlyX family protein [Porticoccaceae bacterium]|nr:SlyX family protein [Porticoccaceae bacterium]
MTADNDRIIELETKLAYQEDTIQALNQVVCRQQDQLDQLQLACETLIERFKDMDAGGAQGQGGEEPPPPHY